MFSVNEGLNNLSHNEDSRKKQVANPNDAPYGELIEMLLDKHATTIELIDLSGLGDIAEAILVVTSRSQTNMHVLQEVSVDFFNQKGLECAVEGENSSRWCLIDSGEVIVNIFSKEANDFYQLANLWPEACVLSFENVDN